MPASELIALVVNIGASAYVIYQIYFVGTTTLNFVLGNIVVFILIAYNLAKLVFLYKVKKNRKKDLDFIKEVAREFKEEQERKNKENK